MSPSLICQQRRFGIIVRVSKCERAMHFLALQRKSPAPLIHRVCGAERQPFAELRVGLSPPRRKARVLAGWHGLDAESIAGCLFSLNLRLAAVDAYDRSITDGAPAATLPVLVRAIVKPLVSCSWCKQPPSIGLQQYMNEQWISTRSHP